MSKMEKFFDINMLLMSLFVSLELIREKKKIELIYDIDPTIPKELRGNLNVVTRILTHFLTVILQHSEKSEVVLSLKAPKDFLYKETISFVIKESGLVQEKIIDLLESKMKSDIDIVNAVIIKNEKLSEIHINIPFKLNELGKRRYYHLPDISMLGKKVLLLTKSNKVAGSLKKMFQYFLYEVDVGVEEYKARGSHLAYYDIFVLEDILVNEGLENLVGKMQNTTDLKYVILRDSIGEQTLESKNKVTYLIRPVMLESIFELIVSLFTKDMENRQIKSTDNISMISMDKYIDEAFVKSENISMSGEIEKKNISTVKMLDDDKYKVLDSNIGIKNTQKMGLIYKEELATFIENFSRSDIYFRDIAQIKAVWQIKEFCINLEKQANLIGAEKVASIAEQVSLLFVYDNLGDLQVYSAKYHIALQDLIREIKRYLA